MKRLAAKRRNFRRARAASWLVLGLAAQRGLGLVEVEALHGAGERLGPPRRQHVDEGGLVLLPQRQRMAVGFAELGVEFADQRGQVGGRRAGLGRFGRQHLAGQRPAGVQQAAQNVRQQRFGAQGLGAQATARMVGGASPPQPGALSRRVTAWQSKGVDHDDAE